MNLPEQTLSNMTTEELINYNQPVAQTVHALESELENTQDELDQTQECLDKAEESLKDAAEAFRRIIEYIDEAREHNTSMAVSCRLNVARDIASEKLEKIGDY